MRVKLPSWQAAGYKTMDIHLCHRRWRGKGNWVGILLPIWVEARPDTMFSSRTWSCWSSIVVSSHLAQCLPGPSLKRFKSSFMHSTVDADALASCRTSRPPYDFPSSCGSCIRQNLEASAPAAPVWPLTQAAAISSPHKLPLVPPAVPATA
jgi:hypothetical protein